MVRPCVVVGCADTGIVVMVSSGASAAAVAGALLHNAKLKSKVYLERIISVVNATSMLCPGNLAHEQTVAAQCAPGLVSTIVLVNIEAVADQVDALQQRLRCINPLANVISAVAGRVTASRDLESLFLLDAGELPWMQRDKVRGLRDQLFTATSLAHEVEAADAWCGRRGLMSQIHLALPPEAVFVRPNLVRAIRSLFASPRGLAPLLPPLASCCRRPRHLLSHVALAALCALVCERARAGGSACPTHASHVSCPSYPYAFVRGAETLGRFVQEGRSRGAGAMELGHLSAIVRMVQSERAEDAGKVCFYVVKAKRGIVTFTKCEGDTARLQTGMRVSGRNIKPEKLVPAFFLGRKPLPEPKVSPPPSAAGSSCPHAPLRRHMAPAMSHARPAMPDAC
jgi:hypothetical protein